MRLLCLAALLTPLAGAQSLDDLARTPVGQARRVSSTADEWRTSNVDYRPIRPGETFTLADLQGPGTIRRLWCTVLPSEPGYARLLTLRIYWDGEKSPSVECPLGDFFGVGHGLDRPYESLPVRASSDGKARSAIWTMPFRKRARVEVTNDGSEATWGFYYTVDWRSEPVAPDAPYFHASYRQSFPTPLGSNYLAADVTGRGHYVGTVLSIRANADGWWGEGDDFFTIDGESEPSLKGTGLEDYFLEAWGLRRVSGLYSGVSVLEDNRATAYRWHVPDPVPFTRSLRVEFEHKGVVPGKEGNNEERTDDFSSVAYWYQTEPHRPYPSLPAGFDRLPFDYRQMVQGESLAGAAVASEGKAEAVKANGLSKNGQLEWVATADGSTLDLPFTVAQAGEFEILLLTTHRWDGGTFEIFVDDTSVGTYDTYSGGYTTYAEKVLPALKLTAGEHRLRFRSVASAAGRAGRWLGLDGFVVRQRG